MPDYADETTTEVERKVTTLQVTCIVETVSFICLLAAMVNGNEYARSLLGALHGMIFLVYMGQVVFLRRDLGWSWGWVVLAIVTGPLGPILVYERNRRAGAGSRAAAA